MSHCDYCDSTSCQNCSSGYLLYANDGSCYTSSTCPAGTYASSTNCVGMVYKKIFILSRLLDCATSNCANCTNLTCQSCASPYSLFSVDGACYDPCPSGTYSNSTDCLGIYIYYPQQTYNIFIACTTANCSECNSTVCQTCSAGYLLYSDDGNCYSNTAGPIGTYANDTNYIGKIFVLF